MSLTRIISGDNARAGAFARQHIGVDAFHGSDFTSLSLVKGLETQAVVLYNNWNPGNSIEVHLAAVPGKRWLTRPFLSAAFRYPFLELGVRRMTALIAADNEPSLRWTRHIGFVQEGIAREAWAEGVDIVIFGMLRSECKYLSGPPPEIWSACHRKTFGPNSARSTSHHCGTITGQQPVGFANGRA